MASTRRGRDSLPDIRAKERVFLREWAGSKGFLLTEDPTLTLDRRSSHGEHSVGFDPKNGIWWKITHPGKAGVGVEFEYDLNPPFSVLGVFARDLLPSEYLSRMILHNREFGDDIRLEGYLDSPDPSLVISQPDIEGSPATASQMSAQMRQMGFLPLGPLQIGKANSISFYHAVRRVAMFDAHPGNFFHANGLTIPVDGIVAEINAEAEHQWLLNQIRS